MTRFDIAANFIYAAAIIGLFAFLIYIFHGFLGLGLYLLFSAVCLTPSVIILCRRSEK